MLNQERVNHEKVQGMNGRLKGEVIIDKLNKDFELLAQFRTVKLDIHSIGHVPLIDMDVLLKGYPSDSPTKTIGNLLGDNRYPILIQHNIILCLFW